MNEDSDNEQTNIMFYHALSPIDEKESLTSLPTFEGVKKSSKSRKKWEINKENIPNNGFVVGQFANQNSKKTLYVYIKT